MAEQQQRQRNNTCTDTTHCLASMRLICAGRKTSDGINNMHTVMLHTYILHTTHTHSLIYSHALPVQTRQRKRECHRNIHRTDEKSPWPFTELKPYHIDACCMRVYCIWLRASVARLLLLPHSSLALLRESQQNHRIFADDMFRLHRSIVGRRTAFHSIEPISNHIFRAFE